MSHRMKEAAVCLVLLTSVSALCGQSFQNLDFESATLVPIPGDPYNRVYLDSALPGWDASAGTNNLSAVLYDNMFLDSPGIAIFDSNWSPPFQGNYTILLEAGAPFSNDLLTPGDASLSQVGLLPSGTKSLSFFASSSGPFAVSLGGTNLTLISSPVSGQSYKLYQADVSSFAGDVAELKFTVFAQYPFMSDLHVLQLDDIQFSPEAIPELSGLSLLAMGVVGLAIFHRASRRNL